MDKIIEFQSKWDQKIEDWHKSPKDHFERDIYSKLYQTESEKYKIKPMYMPEPYLGNPNKNSAVIINKNPGSEIHELQNHKTGKFLTNDNAHSNYKNFAIKFPYLEKYIESDGGKWWIKRKEWIKRLVGKESQSNPFALEVCHWHSSLFGKHILKQNELFYDYLIKSTIEPAEAANKNSELGVILSVGGIFNEFYEKLGFNKELEINQSNFKEYNLKWHLNGKNKPTHIEYTLWKSNTDNYYLNFELGAKYNDVPNIKWKHVEEFLLKKLNLEK